MPDSQRKPTSAADLASPVTAVTAPPKKASRQSVRVACDLCRRRKARCDGRRPVCIQCEKSSAVCRYETGDGETRATARAKRALALEQENEALRETNTELRQELRRRRAAHSPPAGLQSPHAASLSLHAAAQAAFPSWLSPVEYELILSHSNSYAYKELPDMATLKALHARRIQRVFGDLPFSAGPEAQVLRAEASTSRRAAPQPHPSLPQLPPRPGWTNTGKRIECGDVQAWCSVRVPDDMANRLIAFYLEIDHPILGQFDPELFIEDMLDLRTDFCSRLLVTSVLLWACHGYCLIDQRAHALKSALYGETLRLWEQERGADSINTVAAGMLVRLTCTINSNEDLGRSVINDIYHMSERLELRGPIKTDLDDYAKMDESDRRWFRARAHAAWGVFNFVTLHSFSYGPPMMHQLPRFVIPGDAYTWPLPKFMGSTFTKLCKLWMILNEIALAYFAGPQGGVAEHVSIDFAEAQYQRLLEWADQNGPLIKNWDRDAHHQSYVQIIFHTCILELFRPFLGMDVPLKTFNRRIHTPRSVYLASTHQLYCQVLMFPLIHPSANFIFWWYGICQAANAAMTTLEDPNSQQMFLLCLLCLHDLAAGFPVMGNAIAGLLRMATQQGTVKKHYARHLYERLCNDKRISAHETDAGVGFSIDLSESLRGSQSASVSQLSKKFEDMLLQN